MDVIIKHYEGKRSQRGHEVRVNGSPRGGLLVWFLHWGEYQGIDAHHHVGIARVEQDGDTYRVGWFRGTEQTPFDETEYTDLERMFADVDAAIETRSAEVMSGA